MSRENKAGARNKLSKIYRFKKKTGRVKKASNKVEESGINHQARIVVRNLSFQVTENEIRELYEPFGSIEEINLLKRPDGTLVGCGFVQFKNVQDASKAIFKTNKTEFLGRKISAEFAIPKSEYYQKVKKEEVENVDESEVKEEEINESPHNNEDPNVECIVKIPKNQKQISEKIKEQRKQRKLLSKKKRARIVIRNLPFATKPELLRDKFSKYGTIEEIRILKKPDDTPVGVCFIQYERVQSAAQAIHYENLSTFLDRSIVVDWAIEKKKFEETQKRDDENDINIKIEDEVEIKKENDCEEPEYYEENSDCSEENHEETEENFDDAFATPQSHPKRISNDVTEGKTVFIKNIPFTAKNEDLKMCMEQFGPVYYALICIDPMTEHSKGTGFVKFRNVEDAEKCLAAGTELKLHDQVLDPHKALHKNEVNKKKDKQIQKVKDSRNLFLVKEGVVLASSVAAQGVSASDMERRLKLERWKSQILRNLNMFVSKVRLVVHNLPVNMNDKMLRQIFEKYSDPSATIVEARIMRDMRNLESNGIGKSKEYGFVSFTKHEDALKALRKINNNPNIFSESKRPIVSFSIENRVMVNAKQRRVEKSRENNPLWKKRKNSESEENLRVQNKITSKKSKLNNNKRDKNNGTEEQSFAGVSSKPGVVNAGKLGSRLFVKKQSQLHHHNLKKEKKRLKHLKKTKTLIQSRKEKGPKVKQNKPKKDKDQEHFNRLVSDYKTKLSSSLGVKKSKWYDS